MKGFEEPSRESATSPANNKDSNLHAPRILALHGGGTNGEIMRLQCRSLVRALDPHFRLVFPDAPFLCPPHPIILPVYESFGPYRRWLRWQTTQPEADDETTIEEIDYQMRTAMEQDDRSGATGEWVGLLGFSQGAKLVASLLYESQMRIDEAAKSGVKPRGPVEGFAGGRWRFGVCMAGRPPMCSLRDEQTSPACMPRPGALSEISFVPFPEGMDRLRMPTIHVHGMEDAGLPHFRQLLSEYCEKGTTSLIEWDGDHRLPLKSIDVNPVVEAIFKMAKAEGVIVK